MKKLKIDSAVIQHNGACLIVGATDRFEWIDDKKGPRLGTNYTVLKLPDCEKVSVFVPDPIPAFEQGELDRLSGLLQFQPANFEGLEVEAYVTRSGDMKLSAHATKIIPLVPPAAGPRKEGA